MPNRAMPDKARANVSRVMLSCETKTIGVRKVAMGARPFPTLRLPQESFNGEKKRMGGAPAETTQGRETG
jgi:hypothetical protein